LSRNGVKVRVTEGDWGEYATYTGKDIRSVCWLRTTRSFILVSRTSLRIIHPRSTDDLQAFERISDRLLLHDVTVTSDERRLLVVASVTQSLEGSKPSRPSHSEKRILVYNLDTRDTEFQIPVLRDARYITLSVDGALALVTYEDETSPQLFRLRTDGGRARLDLSHSYSLPTATTLTAPRFIRSSQFCHFNRSGLGDIVVLCAEKGGLLHFWDRKSATLLHSVKIHETGAARTKIVWNHANDDHLMFVTGGHGGMLKVWKARFLPIDISGTPGVV